MSTCRQEQARRFGARCALDVPLTNNRYRRTLGTDFGMNRTQSGILNAVGGICAVLILANLILGRLNARSNQSLVQTQNQLNTAKQMQTTLQNLAVRIAQAAQTEPALLELLKRQELRVSLNVDGQIKQVP